MKHIDVHAFKKILTEESADAGTDFINVCTTAEYNEKHIPGIRSVPLDTLEHRVHEFKDKKKIFVHCRSGNRGKQAIEKLEKLGVTAELINVEGGIVAWDKAGFETKVLKNGMPIMQQTLLTAGSLVTLGITLSYFIDARWILLSLFVGGGLMFAGATGWCGMSLFLAKMPWNKG